MKQTLHLILTTNQRMTNPLDADIHKLRLELNGRWDADICLDCIAISPFVTELCAACMHPRQIQPSLHSIYAGRLKQLFMKHMPP